MNLNKKPIYKYVKTLFFGAFISVLTIDDAAATCSVSSGVAALVNFTLNGNINIPRDTPIGTRVYRSNATYPNSEPQYQCTANDNIGIKNAIGAPSNGSNIFPIGTTGLGFKYIWSDRDILKDYYNTVSTYNNWVKYPTSIPYYLEIYKIGPTQTIIEIPVGDIGYYSVGHLRVTYFRNATKMVITQQTCTVSNINVPMGVQPASGFQGINTRMTPTDFAINLNNCPSGINSIKYRLDPTTTIINPTKSVVTLQSSSTASGVGVQILDASSNPLPLGVDNVFSGYAATGGNYSIPLKAAYYQTGYIAKGGSANTSLTFTMTYQ